MSSRKQIVMITILVLWVACSALNDECAAGNEWCESHVQLVQIRAQSIQKEAADKKQAAHVVEEKKEDEQLAGASCGEHSSYMCGRDCTPFSGKDRDRPLACWSPATAWCKLTGRNAASKAAELPQKCMVERDLPAAADLLLEVQSSSQESLDGNARYCYEAGHCSNQVLHANSTTEDIEQYCDAKYPANDGHGIWRSITINDVMPTDESRSALLKTSTSHTFGVLACALRDYYLCDLALCQTHFCTQGNAARFGHLADKPFVNHADIGTRQPGQC